MGGCLLCHAGRLAFHLAEAWTRDGQHRDVIVLLEKAAKEKGTGCL